MIVIIDRFANQRVDISTVAESSDGFEPSPSYEIRSGFVGCDTQKRIKQLVGDVVIKLSSGRQHCESTERLGGFGLNVLRLVIQVIGKNPNQFAGLILPKTGNRTLADDGIHVVKSESKDAAEI